MKLTVKVKQKWMKMIHMLAVTLELVMMLPTGQMILSPFQEGLIESDADSYYAEGASIAADGIEEPTSYPGAIASLNQSKWEEAMQAEMRSLKYNDVWELVELPEDRKVVGKWIYKVKVDNDVCGQV